MVHVSFHWPRAKENICICGIEIQPIHVFPFIQFLSSPHFSKKAMTLISWHLLVIFCSLHVAHLMNFFEHKPIKFRTVIGFGVLNGISIGMLNLSLGFNSVGFYQMTKLAIIPCTVFLETLFLRYIYRKSIKLFLSVLLLGVGIATIIL